MKSKYIFDIAEIRLYYCLLKIHPYFAMYSIVRPASYSKISKLVKEN